jgi:hypothetical protein
LFEKKDGAPISGKEARDKLDMLYYFFSFAKGAWCNPVCAMGFNSSDQVWESWSSPKEPGFSQPLSWFDEHHSEQLENFFPDFMRFWNDKYWNGTFQQAIYWYINANNSNIDVGIILTQTVLENLSLDYAVNECKKSAETFVRLYAFDKIKFLFDCLDIPNCITGTTPKLMKLAEELKPNDSMWKDASYSIVRVRNSLIHPDRKNHGKFEDAMYVTWNLGLWYLELSLLKVCGYSETYLNRLTAKSIGEVEKVPWENKL